MENNTGYLCFSIVLKIIGKSIWQEEWKSRFEGNIENVDYEIIRTARELNLKVKAGRLKMKRLEKTKHPVIAKLKEDRKSVV